MEYQPVDPAYKTLLRAVILFDALLLMALCAAATFLIPAVTLWHGAVIATVLLAVTVLFATLWVARRFCLTGYLVQPGVVYFRTGALWRAQTAVTVNRIQHVEITQGPLERWLGLARLVIYTAGGRGSDLTVPGLPQQHAEKIRDGLLQNIEQQQVTDNDDSNGEVTNEPL
tara:strand:+ start:7824 stop:8336 length:513 start_codon:yes stop_codon:yes gene_type:complete